MTRLWLDTNVLVRFLVREPEDQAQQVAQLMARAERGEIRLLLTWLVLAETFALGFNEIFLCWKNGPQG